MRENSNIEKTMKNRHRKKDMSRRDKLYIAIGILCLVSTTVFVTGLLAYNNIIEIPFISESRKEKNIEIVQEQCSTFMDAIIAGDWERIQDRLPLHGLTSSIPEQTMQNGIVQEMMKTITYEIEAISEQEDGSYIVQMKVENVDLRALLESLPEDISSEEEAREAMILLINDAARKNFDAQLTFVSVCEQEEYEIMIDASFANALTGGMYDILVEIMEE